MTKNICVKCKKMFNCKNGEEYKLYCDDFERQPNMLEIENKQKKYEKEQAETIYNANIKKQVKVILED